MLSEYICSSADRRRFFAGNRALPNIKNTSRAGRDKVKSIYDGVGPRAAVSLKPLIEARLEEYMAIWRGHAERGEVCSRPMTCMDGNTLSGWLIVNGRGKSSTVMRGISLAPYGHVYRD